MHMVPNIDGTMGLKIKTRKHPRHGTQCVISASNKQKPSTISSRKCNNGIWASNVSTLLKKWQAMGNI